MHKPKKHYVKVLVRVQIVNSNAMLQHNSRYYWAKQSIRNGQNVKVCVCM